MTGPAARTALVLGGGGITGIAWELGLLAGLAEHGLELRDADLVAGTSAGSVVGAQLTSGLELDELYARELAPPTGERADRIGTRTVLRWAWAVVGARTALQARARIGRMALATATVPEQQRRQIIASRLPSGSWPQRRLLVTAVQAESGEFVAFDRESRVDGVAVSLLDAVSASCAVPGVWPPTTIGGRRWIDGGVRSPVSADLAAGCERVVVLAPIGRATWPGMSAAAQVAALRTAGARVALITPDDAAHRAIGNNVLDPFRREVSARAGRAQAAAVAGQIEQVWER